MTHNGLWVFATSYDIDTDIFFGGGEVWLHFIVALQALTDTASWGILREVCLFDFNKQAILKG